MSEKRMTDPVTGGQKCMKLARFDLIPHEPLWELAEIYGAGALKYEDNNWLKGYPWAWSLGAMLRHIFKWVAGESIDPESGKHHLGHAAWHCFTLITFERRGLGTDTRRKA